MAFSSRSGLAKYADHNGVDGEALRLHAKTRELLKKPRLQVSPAEPRTHLPAYIRHEI